MEIFGLLELSVDKDPTWPDSVVIEWQWAYVALVVKLAS